MPWEKSFNRNDALTKAMMVFWRLGYNNTAIGDLVTETGASRYGLYDEFGDKEGLFLESLDQYLETIVRPRLGKLLLSTATRKDLKNYFQSLAATPNKAFRGQGCMMCMTAVSVARHNDAAALKVKQYMDLLHECFMRAISQERNIPKETASDQAHFLVGLVQGGAVLSQAGATGKVKAAYYEVGLTAIN